MNFLFLSKRFPQGRDLLTRPYGRFYHLPMYLAERGHRVHIALLSYKGLSSEKTAFDGITWTSDDLWPSGFYRYLNRLEQAIETSPPDWIIGFSDAYFGIIAGRLARRHGIRVAIDAYDDFESYIPWAKPLHKLWRNALSEADLVTAPGPQLSQHLQKLGARRTEVLKMAADPQFRELDRRESRALFELPADRRLVGHIGAFDRRRGCSIVTEAINTIRCARPEVSLVLSGSSSQTLHAPPTIYGLGFIPDSDMPALVNSLDIACVSLADNRFGRSSYPAKLCEAIACKIPVVASALPSVSWMLGNDARFLVPVSDIEKMAERIMENLDMVRADYQTNSSWFDVASKFEKLLSI